MDLELFFGMLIGIVAPTWWHANDASKKGRNFIISFILSFIFVCSVWIGLFGWLMSLTWTYDYIKKIGISWWVGTPLYFIIGGLSVVVNILFVSIFAIPMDNYRDNGKINFNGRIDKYLKKILSFFRR